MKKQWTGRLMIMVLLAVSSGACSDEDNKKTDLGAKDGDAAQPDTGSVDVGQPDSTAPDSARPDLSPDTGQPDSTLAGDGGALGVMCNALISTCPTSTTWSMYIKPFTVANCIKVIKCVDNLYSGTCNTQFQSLVQCAAKITAATQCDSKCVTQLSYLTTNCACPSACGVPCP